MALLKNRKLEVRLASDKDDKSTEIELPVVDPEQIARLVQETSRVVVSHAIIGVGTYVALDTIRKVLIKVVPGH